MRHKIDLEGTRPRCTECGKSWEPDALAVTVAGEECRPGQAPASSEFDVMGQLDHKIEHGRRLGLPSWILPQLRLARDEIERRIAECAQMHKQHAEDLEELARLRAIVSAPLFQATARSVAEMVAAVVVGQVSGPTRESLHTKSARFLALTEAAGVCRRVAADSRNSLFRSGAAICALAIEEMRNHE